MKTINEIAHDLTIALFRQPGIYEGYLFEQAGGVISRLGEEAASFYIRAYKAIKEQLESSEELKEGEDFPF